MNKNGSQIPSIHLIPEHLETGNFLPVYFLCGEDSFTIDNTVKLISSKVKPFLASDFDYETIICDKSTTTASILDNSLAFPFGDGKKIVIVKNYNIVSDKKPLKEYAEKPAVSTVLVFAHQAKVSDFAKEPFKTLIKKNYLFEARELKSDELISWFIKESRERNLKVSQDNAHALMEITGEDKSLLQMQLEKFSEFIGSTGEITFEIIQSLSSSTKEFNIFDLLNAMGTGDKSKALEIGYNLLDSGKDVVFIIMMLTKFITTIAQIPELDTKFSNDDLAAKACKVSRYYYKNCKKAKYLGNEKKFHKAAKALFTADLSVKTTSADPKVILTILISEMLA